jgi:hypothetical protein
MLPGHFLVSDQTPSYGPGLFRRETMNHGDVIWRTAVETLEGRAKRLGTFLVPRVNR